MILSSATLNAVYQANELTQGMAESFLDKYEAIRELNGIKFQRAYLGIAKEAGWVEFEGAAIDLPRRHVAWLFRKLFDIWEEANTLPND